MSRDHLTYDDLLRIVELVKSSEQFSEFRLKIGDIEIELRRRTGAGATSIASDTLPRPPAANSESTPSRYSPSGAATGPAQTSIPAPSAIDDKRSIDALSPDAIVVRAPMVGTFYRAPAPGAPPFVSVGQTVAADTIVCIIEVMKLMNSISAGASGIVMQILVDDAQAVDAHAPLIVLDPAEIP